MRRTWRESEPMPGISQYPRRSRAYGTAENAQNDECYQAVTDRDAVVLVLPRADAALQVSRSRKFPGDQPPRRQTPPPAAQPPGGPVGPNAPEAQPGQGLDHELDSVLSIGPLNHG